MTQPSTANAYLRATLWLVTLGLLAFFLADLAITTRSPANELKKLLIGALTPDFFAVDDLFQALLNTLAFAFQGVALGASSGFLLALFWHRRWVRVFSATTRAVHELFWGLIFLQLTGLSPLTGVLAIAIPYSGIFAKVFAEFLEESDPSAAHALPTGNNVLITLCYARLPLVWKQFKVYAAYRLECGIRSSAILGFIGLPTLGFHLETAFRQGHYATGMALLYILFFLIGSMRWWLKARLLPLYLIGALFFSPPFSTIPSSGLTRFFTYDIIPAPLREQYGGEQTLMQWLIDLLQTQGLPGLYNTLLLGLAALLLTGILTLLLFPLISRQFSGPLQRRLGHGVLVMMRTTPEFFLAFILLLFMGPSMLPGIIALALHTSAIIAHLLGRISDTLTLRADSTTGINRYAWEILPRLYDNFFALLLYRWEIIMRETAILGLIGIPTIGFYIDSAFAEFRFDRALFLILLSVLLNLGVDTLSRHWRHALKYKSFQTQ